jgi:hypothetical protein
MICTQFKSKVSNLNPLDFALIFKLPYTKVDACSFKYFILLILVYITKLSYVQHDCQWWQAYIQKCYRKPEKP